MTRSPSRWHRGIWVAISVHFTVVLTLGLSRHWGYMTSINDLGVFDQAVWGTLNGQFLLNTSNQLNVPINWLGFHFHPVLLLFVPLYALSPNAEWLILAQAAALSLAAWPIFLLASHVCQQEKAGLLWALAYLVNPFLLNAAAWDFHPVSLAVPFLALGILAIEKGNHRLLWFSCLPLLLIQEHMGLSVAGLGLLWRLRTKNWEPAIWLISLGMAHAALVLGVVIPTFSPTGKHLMLDSGLGHLSRYSWLGHSAGGVIKTILSDPLSVTQKVMWEMGGAFYLIMLLLPFLGLPLAGSTFLLPGLADFAANLLSVNPMPRSIFSYHSASLVPIVTAAAIHGAVRVSRWRKRYSITELSGLALVASIIIGYGFAPFPLPGSFDYWSSTHFMNWPDPALPVVRAAMGSEASVSAQANVGTHFAQRRRIFLFPNKIDDVDTIVLRLESPTSNLLPPDPAMITTLAHHLQMRPADYLASVECLLDNGQYHVALWRNPWLALTRGGTDQAQREGIRQKLQQLRMEWRVDAKEHDDTLHSCARPDHDNHTGQK